MVENIDTIDNVIGEFSDSVYLARINSIPSIINLSYNHIVRNFIHVYTVKKRDKLELILGLKDYYFPMFEEVLDFHQMPVELKYLAVIESALNPNAVSKAGATGLWQFMYGTGRMYNLNVNSFIDDRRDPLKATHAAALYLKDLYRTFGDWMLCIAAYNCGPGNVNKAIRRAGGKKNYWDIYYYLPRETRGYIPAFIAATYVLNFYKEHNIKPQLIEMPVATDTIMITRELHLKQVAELLHISIDELRLLNPQYRVDIIPAKTQAYPLRLPYDYAGAFIDLKESVYTYKDSIYLKNYELLKEPANKSYSSAPSGDNVRLYYTVKSGDNLGYISEWYNVRIADLRYWNRIRGNTINKGQRLVIYVPNSKYSRYKNINTMSFAQKQKIKSGGSTDISSSSPKISNEIIQDGYVCYKVKSGDTLWEIAKNSGVSDDDIRKLNNLKDGDKIISGQILKIKKK